MLMVFAISGFAFNLPTVYSNVMSRVSGYVDPEVHPYLSSPPVDPAVDWKQALRVSQNYMAQASRDHGFEIIRPYSLLYRRDKGIYIYKVQSTRDTDIYGDTSVSVDASTGKLIAVKIPTGDNAGNTFPAWTKALHRAMALDFPIAYSSARWDCWSWHSP